RADHGTELDSLRPLGCERQRRPRGQRLAVHSHHRLEVVAGSQRREAKPLRVGDYAPPARPVQALLGLAHHSDLSHLSSRVSPSYEPTRAALPATSPSVPPDKPS